MILGEDPENPETSGTVKIVARTVEELAKQLEADLRGEKDWHDLVVEAEHERMNAVVRDRREKSNALMRDRIREEGERETMAYSSASEGLTPQEVQHRLLRRRQMEHQKAAAKMVRPDMDPRLEAFLDKYDNGADGTYETQEVPQTDRDPSTALPLPTMTRPKPPPFKR